MTCLWATISSLYHLLYCNLLCSDSLTVQPVSTSLHPPPFFQGHQEKSCKSAPPLRLPGLRCHHSLLGYYNSLLTGFPASHSVLSKQAMLLPQKIDRGVLLNPRLYHVIPLCPKLSMAPVSFREKTPPRQQLRAPSQPHPGPLILLPLGCTSHTLTSGPLDLLSLFLEHSSFRYLSLSTPVSSLHSNYIFSREAFPDHCI